MQRHGLRCGFLKRKGLLCLWWLPFYQGLSVRAKATGKTSLDKAHHLTDQSGCQEACLCLGHTSCELVIVERQHF